MLFLLSKIWVDFVYQGRYFKSINDVFDPRIFQKETSGNFEPVTPEREEGSLNDPPPLRFFSHEIIIAVILIVTFNGICDDESIDLKVHWYKRLYHWLFICVFSIWMVITDVRIKMLDWSEYNNFCFLFYSIN